MSQNYPIIPRDISWLSFNHRVLQEAKDPMLPLFERIKFLAIYSNNLDEFFRVRMANHRNLARLKKKDKKELAVDPKSMVKTIQRIVNRQQAEFARIFEKQIIPELTRHGIYLKKRLQLTDEQKAFVATYFEDNMLPYVQPVLLVKDMVRPFLNNAQLYLSILMREKAKPEETAFAIVKIPSDHLPRFIELPGPPEEHHLIMLDDIVRHSVSSMFPGYEIEDTYSIKLTRDAELHIDDEFSGDLVDKIRQSLKRRHVGPASRFVYDREIPQGFLDYLIDMFELEKYDLLREGRYHNNFDFFQFPDFGMYKLKNQPMPALNYPALVNAQDYWAAIEERDHMVHFPYHSYEPTVRFFEEAANDPKVTHIKIIQYRVAKKSRIMKALIKAATSGKQVSVFIEVKARFDEAANLAWGERLEQAGVQVNYSFPGVKVHSKIAIVRRWSDGREQLYTYLSTGNFHEDTAKIYSDFGLFTADPRITEEAARVLAFLETGIKPKEPFKHLIVGQFNLRPKLEDLINFEVAEAKAGRPASIILKMNSLQDRDMIHRIYDAARAGVEVKMIIRGICCLVPAVKEVSNNIFAISIVDRYLEHARVFIFHHGGEDKMYLSSADFMTRNLSYRVETTFPVYDSDVHRQIKTIINLQLADNTKARLLSDQQGNSYRRGGSIRRQSQEETYLYLKRELLQQQEEEEF